MAQMTQPRPAVTAAPALAPTPAQAPVQAVVAPSAPVANLKGTVAVAGRPTAATARAMIVLVARDGGEGPAYPLGESTDIGRTEGGVLLSDDAYISPRHARISLRGQAYYLRDLGSTNGIYVRLPFLTSKEGTAGGVRGQNEEPQEQPLKDQDLFLVGQQVLRFEVVKDAEEGFGVASDNGTLLFGTPASPRFARLVQRTVEGITRDVFTIRKGDTVLGRESGDIVFTDDPFLSRRHAVLRVHTPAPGQERRFSLSDLGSSNGTFLRVSEEVRLRHGDQFRIGQQLFRFDLDATQGGPARA
jgi:pSer/pThr/pTyr-binding forkhead associated (FHA) protein